MKYFLLKKLTDNRIYSDMQIRKMHLAYDNNKGFML